MYGSAGTADSRWYRHIVRVEASPEAIGVVQEHGGKLYVWAKTARCCHGASTTLQTSHEPGERPFRHVEVEGFELYLDARLGEPDELVIETSGSRRKHVHAYWNGFAYMI